MRTRTRAVAVPPQNGGAKCPAAVESRPCDTCAVDGRYGPWGEWGPCSATCSFGVQQRTRECSSPVPRYGGTDCDGHGPSAESRICRLPDCRFSSVQLISSAQGHFVSTAAVPFTSSVQGPFTSSGPVPRTSSVQVPLVSSIQGQSTSSVQGQLTSTVLGQSVPTVMIVGTTQYTSTLTNLAASIAWGQSFTIPGGTSFNHITFNFYKHNDGSPYATGNLHILTSATNGPPSLVASWNDLLAMSTGIASVQGGSQWTFAPSVMLEAGRRYWAYMDQEASEQVSGHLNRVYSGGSGYQSNNDVNFAQTPGNPPGNIDIKFTCYGKPVQVPTSSIQGQLTSSVQGQLTSTVQGQSVSTLAVQVPTSSIQGQLTSSVQGQLISTIQGQSVSTVPVQVPTSSIQGQLTSSVQGQLTSTVQGQSVSDLPAQGQEYAGVYGVYYQRTGGRKGRRTTDMIIGCDISASQPGIFTDMLRFTDVGSKCTQGRDAQATMYILDTHGPGKYECLRPDGTSLVGSHYTGPNAFWGTVEYRLMTNTDCGVDCRMAEWGPWGPCNFQCPAAGQHWRWRAVVAPEGDDGAAKCLDTAQTRDCNPCDGPKAPQSDSGPKSSGPPGAGSKPKGPAAGNPRANIQTKLTFEALALHVQQYLGFVLGRVPTAAPQVTSTELVMYGTQMAVGTWLSTSFSLPRVTVGAQKIEITNWGEGVERATIVVHDQGDAVTAVGISLDPPSEFHSWASQVVSVTRWDVNGNKISFGPLDFTLCLGADYATFGSPPEFHRYDDGSSVPNHLINEGGTVADAGGCYNVRTLRTSSLAAFNISASPSPGASPSPSHNATAAGDTGSDTALLGLLALLVIPFIAIGLAMLYWSKRAARLSTESAQYVLGPYPLIATNMQPPPPMPSPFASAVPTPAVKSPAPYFGPSPPFR